MDQESLLERVAYSIGSVAFLGAILTLMLGLFKVSLTLLVPSIAILFVKRILDSDQSSDGPSVVAVTHLITVTFISLAVVLLLWGDPMWVAIFCVVALGSSLFAVLRK